MSSSLSPIDIEHASFETAAMGYRKSSVKAFLQRVASELDNLLQQQRRAQEHSDEQAARITALLEAEAELKRAVIAAERIGHEMKENAKREAELMVEGARLKADGLLREVEAELSAAHAELARLERSQSIVREQLRGQLSGFLRALDAGPMDRRSLSSVPAIPAPSPAEVDPPQGEVAAQDEDQTPPVEMHAIGEEDLHRT